MQTIVSEADCPACAKLFKTLSKDDLCDFYVEEGDLKKVRSQCNDIDFVLYILYQIESFAGNEHVFNKDIINLICEYREDIKKIL
jgi:hypothetical protein